MIFGDANWRVSYKGISDVSIEKNRETQEQCTETTSDGALMRMNSEDMPTKYTRATALEHDVMPRCLH